MARHAHTLPLNLACLLAACTAHGSLESQLAGAAIGAFLKLTIRHLLNQQMPSCIFTMIR